MYRLKPTLCITYGDIMYLAIARHWDAEGGHPQSRLDMISKFEIALKEAFETDRWLQIIHTANLIPGNIFDETNKLCTKIRVLLISSIKTLKSK